MESNPQRCPLCGTELSGIKFREIQAKLRPDEQQRLPDVQHSLNWVHLATRFPVRVRILAPETEPFRLSESGVVVMRPPRLGEKP